MIFISELLFRHGHIFLTTVVVLSGLKIVWGRQYLGMDCCHQSNTCSLFLAISFPRGCLQQCCSRSGFWWQQQPCHRSSFGSSSTNPLSYNPTWTHLDAEKLSLRCQGSASNSAQISVLKDFQRRESQGVSCRIKCPGGSLRAHQPKLSTPFL